MSAFGPRRTSARDASGVAFGGQATWPVVMQRAVYDPTRTWDHRPTRFASLTAQEFPRLGWAAASGYPTVMNCPAERRITKEDRDVFLSRRFHLSKFSDGCRCDIRICRLVLAARCHLWRPI